VVALCLDRDGAAEGAALTLTFPQVGKTTWWYDSTRLDATDVARMQAEFGTLLAKGVAGPDTSIASLLSTSDAPWRALLEKWNSTSNPFPGRLRRSGTARLGTPDGTAVVAGAESLTYSELDRRSSQLARHLRRLGVGPDVPVGRAVERSTGLLVGMLGILKAGGAYVPLDPTYPSARLTMMLEDSAAHVVVTEEAVQHRVPEEDAAGAPRPRLAVDRARGGCAAGQRCHTEQPCVRHLHLGLDGTAQGRDGGAS
jgi:non-ribosomal peptide synthetase component F